MGLVYAFFKKTKLPSNSQDNSFQSIHAVNQHCQLSDLVERLTILDQSNLTAERIIL